MPLLCHLLILVRQATFPQLIRATVSSIEFVFIITYYDVDILVSSAAKNNLDIRQREMLRLHIPGLSPTANI